MLKRATCAWKPTLVGSLHDSPLEGDGFELSVLLREELPFGDAPHWFPRTNLPARGQAQPREGPKLRVRLPTAVSRANSWCS